MIGHLSRTGFPGTGRKGKKTGSPTIERGGSAGSRFQTPGRESKFKGNSYGAARGMLRGKVLPSSLVRHGRNGREACFGGKSGGSRRGLPDGMAGPFCPFF
ncbi:MAG: hypothetical protein C6W57_04755 [Caldibacillus debilis]|nr:MAG: hypothetical protein C6W57_04755 [Caldibacillus debilis]REJ31286.1 MAG: hypothetical protein C6W56_00820 [Caldibacillus debilis]